MTVGLIDTGCANLASVRFALERAGIDYKVVLTPAQAATCGRLILPGVGAAAPAMKQLDASGWSDQLRREERPLLGICLGMQLLFEYSEESDVACLGLVPGEVARLPQADGLVWPHMGWNALDVLQPNNALLSGIENGDYMYFVHGFYVPASSVALASTRYGADISAIVNSRHVYGCQFHPERSGDAGARILKNFAELVT